MNLWYGVAIVTVQWLLRFGLPLVAPDLTMYAVIAGLAGFVGVLVWWLGFSRAPWTDRIAAVVLMFGTTAERGVSMTGSSASSRPGNVSVFLPTVGMLIVAVVFLSGCSPNSGNQPQGQSAVPRVEYRNAEYTIEGQRTKVAETEPVPVSASRVVTRYFGNELKTDLNDDGREDVVFLLTQQRGGSGTFFYAVAALNTKAGYLGSDGYLLGDRIAPQTIEVSRKPRHKDVVVVHYADRGPGDPITAQPSVGKSVYLKLDADTVRWGVVAPDFEGESR